MWFPITPEDSDVALNFASETVHNTYNRMGYSDTPQNIEKREFHIYVGKVAEQVVFRYIQDILELKITQDTHIGGPDQFDFKIEYQGKRVWGMSSVSIFTAHGIPNPDK